ncbi:MAG: bifunctional pyr operon transcriptional regulator/uracil phosphoribosyltransferase PyrR [Endomicrobiia bacterium]|jgi:pyrimidine operon attenuation protein/uracil phosphoribosyltransferase|nr:bifunctional pyr operon transcriptional regulator/uracil phosphoribosyltransferase PyrR [Endomicrobiaceae bacterium]MDD3053134.1 bifunctional pyr operon transcriptional regulator/uracil phosphoribosyltransferase PyrR [Endomicrobiaceae bacterium]MDD3922209.1 bifunctional pyr operon transcriptional regulator/uracil phosphoribosyltransferase PyrR [Endomicrobiaceae bacterium]
MADINKKIILDSKHIQLSITKLAKDILSKNIDISEIAIVGIQTRGVYLAKRLLKELLSIKKIDIEIPFGILDITLYRDDLGEMGADIPTIKDTNIPFDINAKNIILVDDVLYTGRTIRCALDVLKDYGRPKSIQLAVLIDRGYRELPIQANFVGLSYYTKEQVCVELTEVDGQDVAYCCD